MKNVKSNDIKFNLFSSIVLPNTRNATATIFKSEEVNDGLIPFIALFSSRGPNPITPNILKVTLHVVWYIIKDQFTIFNINFTDIVA